MTDDALCHRCLHPIDGHGSWDEPVNDDCHEVDCNCTRVVFPGSLEAEVTDLRGAVRELEILVLAPFRRLVRWLTR